MFNSLIEVLPAFIFILLPFFGAKLTEVSLTRLIPGIKRFLGAGALPRSESPEIVEDKKSLSKKISAKNSPTATEFSTEATGTLPSDDEMAEICARDREAQASTPEAPASFVDLVSGFDHKAYPI